MGGGWRDEGRGVGLIAKTLKKQQMKSGRKLEEKGKKINTEK